MARSSPTPVRLIDIAAKAGVSATVVSTVLRGGGGGTVRVSEQTAQQIRQIAEQMNYRPNVAAQLLKGKRSDVVGVLIGAESTAANFERLAAIEHEAYQRGLRLMVGLFREDTLRTTQYIQDFLSRGVDSLICFHNPLPRQDPQVLSLLRRVKHLIFQTEPLLPGACCVDVDRASGVRMAVGHLAERGRERIALVLNRMDDPLMQDRLRGYRAGLEDQKRTFQASLLWAGTGVFPPTADLVQQAVVAVVEKGHADAIIASNDVWAIELAKAMRRRGVRVPQDVAVVGFDNLPAAALFDPGLTTIDQNNEAFARAIIDLLQESMEQGSVPASRRTIVVPPRLIIREST